MNSLQIPRLMVKLLNTERILPTQQKYPLILRFVATSVIWLYSRHFRKICKEISDVVHPLLPLLFCIVHCALFSVCVCV
jgi:hypothetical protein